MRAGQLRQLLELGGPGPGIGGASGDLAVAQCEPGTTRRPVLCRQTAKRTGRQTAKRTGRQTLAANAPCFEDVERINNVERRRTRDVHETRHGVVSAKGGLCVALAMAARPNRCV